MKVYLDTNIIIDLFDGEYPNLLDSIKIKKKRGSMEFPFSSTHIEELCKINSSEISRSIEEIHNRLNFLSELSSNIYFCNDMISTEYRNTHPNDVFNTLNEIPFKINYNDLFSSLINYESIKNSREKLELNPQYLNNIDPSNATKEIDIILAKSKESLGIEYSDVDLSIIGILEKAFQISEEAHSKNSYHKVLSKKESYNLENFIVMLFSLLDSFGFWADKKEVFEKGSRYADAIHCFNGSYHDIVISNDLRFCKKSLSVYNHLSMNTRVLHLKNNFKEINDLLNSAT